MSLWKALFLSFGLCISFVAPLAAQTSTFVAVEAPEESYGEAANISAGAVIVGILAIGPEATKTPSLSAFVPSGWDRLCVRLLSNDGRYVAHVEYRSDGDWQGEGAAPLGFATRYPEVLKAATAKRMAVLVLGGACDAVDPPVAIGGWNIDPLAKPAEIVLLVNSFRADETYVFVPDTGAVVRLPADRRWQADCVRFRVPAALRKDARGRDTDRSRG